jgi:hypothetical protein
MLDGRAMQGVRILCQMSWRDRILMFEAVLWLTVASIAVASLPFRHVRRIAELPVRRIGLSPGSHAATVRRVRWSIIACARRAPWRARCFQRGLAAHCMLRRRGVASVLYYGAAPDAKFGLVAHVWVRDGDIDIIGGDAAERFPVLATFPAGAPVVPEPRPRTVRSRGET